MKKIHRPFTYARELRPVEEGVCSSKFLDCVTDGEVSYVCSQYYRKGEEGVMLVSRRGEELDCQIIPTETRTALFPKLALLGYQPVCAWSEYVQEEDCWKVTVWNGRSVMLETHTSLILCDAMAVDGHLLLACTRFFGHTSDIVVLELEGTEVVRQYEFAMPGVYASRAMLVRGKDGVSLCWDGYSEPDGYDIYFARMDSQPVKLTEGSDWYLRPDASVDSKGVVYISYIRSIDVHRDGVIGRAEGICLQALEDGVWRTISAEEPFGFQQNLYTGLLPDVRYFGYVGLRRNPRVVLDGRDTPFLFWEKQVSEQEDWDHVENGTLMMKNVVTGQTFLVQEGGNSYCMSKTPSDQIVFALRGEMNEAHQMDLDIISYPFDAPEPSEIPYFEGWDRWKPVDLRQAPKKTPGILWGDLHCHSIHSADAEGYADELYFYARDKAHLDFSGVTDNDCYYATIFTYSESMYQELICRTISEEGRFLAFNGYEWTYYHAVDTSQYNHRSIIFFDRDRKIARRSDDSGNSVEAFLSTMESVNSGWHSHHATWQLTGRPQDGNVEIASSWNINIETCDHVIRTLDEGFRFGFMASSDNHRYIPGNSGSLTAVLADQTERDTIINAIKAHRVYATAGNRVRVEFSVNGAIQGSEARGEAFRGSFTITSSDAPIERIEALSDHGRCLCGWNGEGQRKLCEKFDIPAGCSYVFLRIQLEGACVQCPHNISPRSNPLAWSSPVFLAETK